MRGCLANIAMAPDKNDWITSGVGPLWFKHPNSVSQMGRLPGIASICRMYASSVLAVGSQEPAFHPYQCAAMKSTRSRPVVSALTWPMNVGCEPVANHARPVVLAWVAGLP